MAKGSAFEREICRALSAWWTGDPDADVCFWRTAQSGGRATSRTKQARKTHSAHCGDISALDESAAVLTRLVTFELKRGYSTASLHAVLDRSTRSAEQIYEKWVEQARASATAAETPFWAIIHKRNGREATMTVPRRFADVLGLMLPISMNSVDGPFCVFALDAAPVVEIASFQFDAFLRGVSPNELRNLHKRMNAQRA